MFVCKICASEVKKGQAYCSKCGADVVENYETVCPVCGRKNTAGSRYCSQCGGILEVMKKPVCSVCGSKNLPGAKFCVSCGAPIIPDKETHSDRDIYEIRKAKSRIDEMERERMEAVDREIAEKLSHAEEDRLQALQDVEDYRKRCEADYHNKIKILEAYRDKLNEFGADDVKQLRQMAERLKEYAEYYADPYSQLDDEEIQDKSYVCPACGAVNPSGVTACLSCGRSKARSALLLAKNKIKQSPPKKRRKPVIPPPEPPAPVQTMPSLEEFAKKLETEGGVESPLEIAQANEEKQQTSPRPAYGFPQGAGFMYPAYMIGKDGEPYQMPPIVQPVAFVPYVTQDQPLVQYVPAESAKTEQASVAAQVETKPRKATKTKKGSI